MSFSRFRESRGRASRQAGFSASAAFVFAVILAGVGLGIQATMPVTTSPASLSRQQLAESQPAAVFAVIPVTAAPATAAPATASTPVECDPSTSADKTKYPCKPGFDYIINFAPGSDVLVPTVMYFPVCPIKAVQPRDPGMAFVKGWGLRDRCSLATGKLEPNKGVQWKSRTLNCEKIFTDSQFGVSQKIYEGVILKTAESVPNGANAQRKEGEPRCYEPTGTDSGPTPVKVATPTVEEILKKFDEGDLTPEQIKAMNLDVETQRTLNDAFLKRDDAIQDELGEIDAKRDEDAEMIKNLATCSINDPAAWSAVCKDFALPNGVPDEDAIEGAKKQLAADEAARKAREKELEAQMNNLASAQSALKADSSACPTDNCQRTGPGSNGQTPDTRTPSNNQPPSGGQSPPGGGFSDPRLGAGGTPQSPLGGACTTGYVCQGNTLYYQTAAPQYTSYNPIVVQGQCQTTPIQQCQYGCQQAMAAMGQQGSAQSGLGGIMAGVQLFSALSSMFGGGSNNNSSMANPNQSRSCAVAPQQQNPNGTGTNGQACQQSQQQQPDPAQCSSGSWKPLSQNGCFSGWQCVPNGSTDGSANAAPTAQISCQPKTADVGMPISISFSCGNANGSAGTGFDTGGQLSGSTTTNAPEPPTGQNIATYTLTCIKLGITTSARCDVQIGKPGIVLVTNPKGVKGGEISTIGWVTSGMKSCVISSADQHDFTSRNSGNTSTSGAATTSPITQTTHFQLDCETLGGGTKKAETYVSISE